MAKLKAFEDPRHEGNSERHHTGKHCIERGCERPAGTAWSPLWCHPCNVTRMRRIDGSLRRAAARPTTSPAAALAALISSLDGVVRRPGQVNVCPPPSIEDDVDGTAADGAAS